MAKHRVVGFFSLLALHSFLVSASAYADSVDNYIRMRMEKEHIPGLSLAVVKDGKVVKAKAYGYANLELNVPATSETEYQIGSVTKQFTAVAVLILVQEHKISLDAPLGQYIPNTPDSWKEITIRSLLTHTSGLQGDSAIAPKALFADYTEDEMFNAAVGLPLIAAPKTKFSYSNLGYNLLAAVVEKVSGQSYADFLRDHIFQPLGMNSSAVNDRYSIVRNRAQGFLWTNARLQVCQQYSTMRFLGSASIISTSMDLAKWAAALNSDKILSAESRKLMWTSGNLSDGSATGYGFGWYTGSIKKHAYIHHNGAMNGFEANVSIFPDDRVAVILLLNQSGLAATEKMAIGVARNYIPDIRPSIQGKAPSFIKLERGVYSQYVGRYEWWNNYMLTLTPGDSELVGQLPGGGNDEYKPISATSFWNPEEGVQLTVLKNATGGVTGLRVRQDDGWERTIPRVGPMLHSLTQQPDPDPAWTLKTQAALLAMGTGTEAVATSVDIAPGKKKDFTSLNANFAGVTNLSFIAAEEVADRGIERHNEKISRILYYRFAGASGSHFVLIYLNPNGLIADTDVVDD